MILFEWQIMGHLATIFDLKRKRKIQINRKNYFVAVLLLISQKGI